MDFDELRNDLLNKVEEIVGKTFTLEEIDKIFEAYYWKCMGINRDKTKLIYIESPMGSEIYLYIDYKSMDEITIKSYIYNED